MKIYEVGHPAYQCKDLETSLHFYRDILGLPVLFDLKYEEAGRKVPGNDDRWIVYVQIGRQFLELFDGSALTKESPADWSKLNYSHLALVTDDLMALHQHLIDNNIPIDDAPKMGPDHTWQMWTHDPDGNMIEFMQYTDESFQLVGKH